MTASKWRKRYELQIEANNLLSDRLRKTREWSRNAMNFARQHMAAAQAEIIKLQARVVKLEAYLVDFDIKEDDEDSA